MDKNKLLELKKKAYEKINKITEKGSNDYREGQIDGIMQMIETINKILEEMMEKELKEMIEKGK